MNKPRLHIFKGRWYCVGNGVGHGLTPELAYYSWRDVCAANWWDDAWRNQPGRFNIPPVRIGNQVITTLS